MNVFQSLKNKFFGASIDFTALVKDGEPLLSMCDPLRSLNQGMRK